MLKQDEDGVLHARGPVDSSKDEIVELCAWVFQRGDENAERGDSDAAVTEMTEQHEHGGHRLLKGEGQLMVGEDHWELPLMQVGEGDLTMDEEAFAVAVAMTRDRKTGKQRVIWWGHPVKVELDRPS